MGNNQAECSAHGDAGGGEVSAALDLDPLRPPIVGSIAWVLVPRKSAGQRAVRHSAARTTVPIARRVPGPAQTKTSLKRVSAASPQNETEHQAQLLAATAPDQRCPRLPSRPDTMALVTMTATSVAMTSRRVIQLNGAPCDS